MPRSRLRGCQVPQIPANAMRMHRGARREQRLFDLFSQRASARRSTSASLIMLERARARAVWHSLPHYRLLCPAPSRRQLSAATRPRSSAFASVQRPGVWKSAQSCSFWVGARVRSSSDSDEARCATQLLTIRCGRPSFFTVLSTPPRF
eukprot:3686323-Pleurochrysis_carterae.AAC.6